MSRTIIRRKQDPSKQNDRTERMGSVVFSAKDDKSMHKSLNGEFILYQVLLQQILDDKEALLTNESSLLNYFEPDDIGDKKVMNEFDTSYNSKKAIHWYTRESCIYKILNKALRTQNIDDVSPFYSFIRDLNGQLGEQHKLFVKQQTTSVIKVYRGQLISKDEVNRLKAGIGQFISMNSFLSTSTNKKKALEFATSRAPPNDIVTSILLEITVDLNAKSKPYADIRNLSAFSEEEEILFMLGCIFRIDNIYYDEKIKLWMANLTLCSDEDQDMKNLSSSLDGQLKGQNQLIAIGYSFIDMLKYADAQELFEKILKQNLAKNDIEHAYCYHGLAKVNEKQGNSNLSIEHLNKALNYLSKNSSNDHPLISQCYNDLGLAYSNQNNYETAFKFFDKALQIKNNISSVTYSNLSHVHFQMKHYQLALEYLEKSLQHQSNTDLVSMTKTYIDMGKIYTAMNKKEEASKIFDKALKTQIKELSPDHPDLSYTYAEIGLMYSELGDQQKALEFIEKAYKVQCETLPNNHPDLGQSYKNFGNIYMKLGDLDKALSYYEKLLENQLKTLSSNHPSVIETYYIIGTVYWKKKDYNQASIYFNKALDGELERSKAGDSSLSFAYKILGKFYYDKYHTHSNKNDLNNALNYFLKCLDNELETKPNEDKSLIILYEFITDICFKNNDWNQLLVYNNRLLNCYLRKTPLNQSMINRIYTLIGQIYLKKSQFDKTILFYKRFENVQMKDKTRLIENINFEKRHLDQSLNYFQNFLNKQLETHSKTDPVLANTYYILANICYEQENFNKSLYYFIELLNNALERKTVNDPTLENIYKAIATIYFQQNNYDKSLIYLYRLLDCQLKTKTIEDSSIMNTYVMIGNIYLKRNYFETYSNNSHKKVSKEKLDKNIKSIENDTQFNKQHLNQAFVFFYNLLKKKNVNLSLCDIYTILGYIYLDKRDYFEALNYFEKLLYKQIEIYKFDYPSVAHTYLIVGDIYDRISLLNSRK
ncbi:unnamed protein product [Adineta steineri]|uniref:UDP-N-acetylglucosamine--peptide N-acetylglucosaminyltransferase SPINDLY n=1 Tax=Adineta steineri TaxID=433720 RepID=A0A814QFT2_9BILA|nr:unnamed protein product [Adineta steineri]CAF1119035.1 unnamed protein product [Adineta steineri]